MQNKNKIVKVQPLMVFNRRDMYCKHNHIGKLGAMSMSEKAIRNLY